MDNLNFQITHGEPTPEDLEAISSGLLASHASQGHPRKREKFCIFLKDNQNKAYGGIIVTFSFNYMHIDSLWVDESLRGKNYGRKLVSMAEEEALKRNCTVACTDTFSYQAPKFYEKLGYTIYGKLENVPEGSTLYYYSKN